jgi:hypothetical protein
MALRRRPPRIHDIDTLSAAARRRDQRASFGGACGAGSACAQCSGSDAEAADVVELVDANAAELEAGPVWLFSGGTVGDPPKPDPPAEVEALAGWIRARGHRVVPGKLD